MSSTTTRHFISEKIALERFASEVLKSVRLTKSAQRLYRDMVTHSYPFEKLPEGAQLVYRDAIAAGQLSEEEDSGWAFAERDDWLRDHSGLKHIGHIRRAIREVKRARLICRQSGDGRRPSVNIIRVLQGERPAPTQGERPAPTQGERPAPTQGERPAPTPEPRHLTCIQVLKPATATAGRPAADAAGFGAGLDWGGGMSAEQCAVAMAIEARPHWYGESRGPWVDRPRTRRQAMRSGMTVWHVEEALQITQEKYEREGLAGFTVSVPAFFLSKLEDLRDVPVAAH